MVKSMEPIDGSQGSDDDSEAETVEVRGGCDFEWHWSTKLVEIIPMAQEKRMRSISDI